MFKKDLATGFPDSTRAGKKMVVIFFTLGINIIVKLDLLELTLITLVLASKYIKSSFGWFV